MVVELAERSFSVRGSHLLLLPSVCCSVSPDVFSGDTCRRLCLQGRVGRDWSASHGRFSVAVAVKVVAP